MMQYTYFPGDRVKCLIPHLDACGMIVKRYDQGTVIQVKSNKATVQWALGVTTTVHMSTLLPVDVDEIRETG